ncbi:MAG: hypothetical protein J0H53_05475 [Rhizobiales bacterium]|nr:hypothetical protein [Hyphomicrobiales bacterium]OJU37148.1 MAG: hypothetical protein BGN94_08140 [Rhizobiales bacterium 68-8]
MDATVKQTRIDRAIADAPIFIVTGRARIALRAGTVIHRDGLPIALDGDLPISIDLADLAPGTDFAVLIEDGAARAVPCPGAIPEGAIGGFHYAPSGNAEARAGGDGQPAINPFSCWDIGFRPGCDPRGMTLVMVGGHRLWVDIYLLGTDHLAQGTSRCGAAIADGRDLPQRVDGKGACRKLDHATAVEIYAHHGKRLLGAEEFFAAAFGVAERKSLDDEPSIAGALDGRGERFVSARGLHGATGTMWQWGTDGDPDEPRPSIFGGSWIDGQDAGSRYAYLVGWPDNSVGSLSARGCRDHES